MQRNGAKCICLGAKQYAERCFADALRAVALHDAPPLFAEERRRNPVIRPSPDSTLGRAVATKQTVQIADVQDEPARVDSPSGTTGAQLAKLAGARCHLIVQSLALQAGSYAGTQQGRIERLGQVVFSA